MFDEVFETKRTPGTKVKLNDYGRAFIADGENEEYVVLDEYTLKEFRPRLGWWEVEELYDGIRLFLTEKEFEVIE